MTGIETMTYEVAGRIARITLNRPERGNGITEGLVGELERCVERADLDPAVHVILLAGNGKGFCGGYDLVESAEGQGRGDGEELAPSLGSPLDPTVMAANHDPLGHLGSDGRLRDDEPQRPRVHVAVSLRKARGLQGAWFLRCGRNRHGVVHAIYW